MGAQETPHDRRNNLKANQALLSLISGQSGAGEFDFRPIRHRRI